MISDVKYTPLKQIKDERGKVMHMLKATDPYFEKFGEIYFSWIYANKIKAWSKHLKMSMNYAVPVGNVKVVLFDDRKDSNTFGKIAEYYLGEDNYYLLTIPNNIWYGIIEIGKLQAMVANCATIVHDTLEIIKLDPFDPKIPYNWSV